jgi:DNA-binding transcriptional LysR family regulator
MDLRQLDMFRAVAKRGSLRHAAAQLGVTVPAVSIQIKKLEQQLSAQLFLHLPNKLVLTAQGLLFLQEVNGIFKALERAAASVRPGANGSISVALASDIAELFTDRIAAFAREYPDVRISVLARPSSRGLALLVDNEIDMCIGFIGRAPKGIVKVAIHQTPLRLVVPRDHPLAKRNRPSLADIAAQKLVSLSRPSAMGRAVAAVFEREHLSPDSVMEVGTCQAAMKFVEAGLGIALVHHVCVHRDQDQRFVYKDVGNLFGCLDISLAARQERLRDPLPQALIRHLVAPLDGKP